jgi:hypothetical protein
MPGVISDDSLLIVCYFRLSSTTLASYPELSRLR